MISHSMADAIKKNEDNFQKNKQVYTGIASAQNQQMLDNQINQTVVNEASEEIFIDKAI